MSSPICGGKMKLSTKLKYIEIKPIYIVLAVILAVALRFWGENSITMLQKEVPEIKTTEISGAEIYRYIKVKQAYINENFNIDWASSVQDFEENLDESIHEWFLVHKWRPARFVYVQYRINKILQHIQNREVKLQEADRMDEEAKHLKVILQQNPTNELVEQQIAKLHSSAEDIRYYRDREIRMAGITQEEENIVLQNRKIIEEIIDQ